MPGGIEQGKTMLITKRHQQRCLAKHQRQQGAQQALASVASTRAKNAPVADQVQTVVEALGRDIARLKAVESVEAKIVLKRELLPQYTPIADGYLESGANYQNHLLFYCALWSLDVDDLEAAFKYFDNAVAQQQATPDNFNRDMPTIAAELIAEWAEREYKAERSASPYIDRVCERLDGGQWVVTTTIVTGKVYKVAGLLCERAGELKEALAFYEKAMAANDKSGCKTRLDKLKKQLDVA